MGFNLNVNMETIKLRSTKHDSLSSSVLMIQGVGFAAVQNNHDNLNSCILLQAAIINNKKSYCRIKSGCFYLIRIARANFAAGFCDRLKG